MLAEDVVVCQAEEYIDNLWFFLHHRERDDDLLLGLTCYFDDSGTDDGSPFVTIGGPLLSRIQAKEMSRKWAQLIQSNKLEPPLHMKDFVGHGKLSTWPREFKRGLFRDACRIVNEHKLYSVSISISRDEFNHELAEDVRSDLIGPYAMAFFTAVALTQGACQKTVLLKDSRIAYLVDRGAAHSEQLDAAHKVISDIEKKSGQGNTGTLGFETDDSCAPLQAADMIAWAARRRQLDGSFSPGFEPLEDVLAETEHPYHAHVQMPLHGIKMLATPINNWITKFGEIPKLENIIR